MSEQIGTPRPATCLKAGSSLVRRLVEARDDPAKQRVRAWLRDIDDRRLSDFGLTREDIAVLRSANTKFACVSWPASAFQQ
jgi:uncharacterized protein YjiS (DUF1127 family)